MKAKLIFVVGLLLLTSFAAINVNADADEIQSKSIAFSEPIVRSSNIESYIEIELDEYNGYIHKEGEPILPIYTEYMELPFGTKITDVSCVPKNINTVPLTSKIIPAPKPLVAGSEDTAVYEMKTDVYGVDEAYPETWYKVFTNGGLNKEGEHKTFVSIRTYPVRYNPVSDNLLCAEGFDIEVNYQTPETNILPTNSEYDMVIITPSKLYDNTLNDLVEHKNNKGIKTYVKTTNEIYSEYQGYDHAEQIKYFIKDALETYGIKYVLLVGGLDSYVWGDPRDSISIGDKDWHLPVRYSDMRYETGKTADPGMITDLYFADIFDGEGVFQTWDNDKNGNSDGIYARWAMFGNKDYFDAYPDVFVGRLACRNVFEVKIMTHKIMDYENGAYGSSWADKFIVVGGDSHNDPGTDILEGEVMCDKLVDSYMTEYDIVKLYASNKDSDPSHTPVKDNIVREISDGAGHLFFDGHANPGSWNTHWPGYGPWTGGIQVIHFPLFKNKGEYPICNVEGCHNSQFNISIIGTILDADNSQKTWCYGNPVPQCWSWWMARKFNGGALATTGNTGLGYGAVGENGDLDGDGVNDPDTVEALGGYFFSMTYKNLDEGAEYLGDMWGGGILDYMNTWPPADDQLDMKEMEQLCLLGDPSLKIGGYGSAGNSVNIEGDSVSMPSQTVEQVAYVPNGNSYSYAWDLDEDGAFDDASTRTVDVQFDKPGYYEISVKATNGAETKIDSKLIEVTNEVVPSDPAIVGPATGKVGQKQTYSFTAEDPGEDEIYFLVDWGDGEYSVAGPVASGQTATAKHTWSNRNTYNIKVKAFDSFAGESDWSQLSVTMPKTIENYPFLSRLSQRFPMVAQIFDLPMVKALLGI